MSSILYFVGLIIALISVILSFAVQGSFKKHSKKRNYRNISGKEVAESMLRRAGIYDVSICMCAGTLTDHYNPKTKIVNLSEAVYNQSTVAAAAVAAHECGHAIQHHEGYLPVVWRSSLVPVANVGSRFGILLFIIGLFFGTSGNNILLDIGILLFAGTTLFHFVTLPVEFDASKRALVTLSETSVLITDEMSGACKVLMAAALTYVAAAAQSAIQLLRLIAIRNNK